MPPYPFLFAGGLRLQYRRHRHPDRRPAQHPDRLAGRPRLQRLRHPPHAGDRRGHGGAGADDPPRSGARRLRSTPSARRVVMGMSAERNDPGLDPAQAVARGARRSVIVALRARAPAASRACDHRDRRRRDADAARQLAASHREAVGERAQDLRRRRMDHDLLLHRPVRRGAWRRGRRPACTCSPTSWSAATGGEHGAAPATPSCGPRRFLSAIVDNIPFVATMIPLIKSMAPAYRRRRQDRAATFAVLVLRSRAAPLGPERDFRYHPGPSCRANGSRGTRR